MIFKISMFESTCSLISRKFHLLVFVYSSWTSQKFIFCDFRNFDINTVISEIIVTGNTYTQFFTKKSHFFSKLKFRVLLVDKLEMILCPRGVHENASKVPQVFPFFYSILSIRSGVPLTRFSQ